MLTPEKETDASMPRPRGPRSRDGVWLPAEASVRVRPAVSLRSEGEVSS